MTSLVPRSSFEHVCRVEILLKLQTQVSKIIQLNISYFKDLSVISFKPKILQKFSKLKVGALEKIENIEQEKEIGRDREKKRKKMKYKKNENT